MSRNIKALDAWVERPVALEHAERIQHHARRFQEKDAPVVLRRYEQRRGHMSKAEMDRHAFHVAAWLVALSPDAALRTHGGLSVVSLLSQYLESLQDGRLGDRLAGMLPLVIRHVESSLGDDPQKQQLLMQIGQHMPRAAKVMRLDSHVPCNGERVCRQDCLEDNPQGGKVQRLVSRDIDIPTVVNETRSESLLNAVPPVDGCAELQPQSKAVRLMQKSIQTWKNTPLESRESYVELLEQAVEDADSANLPQILRRAVAALSPPRGKAEGESQGIDLLQTELSACRDLQARLRKIVLWCLDQLDLTDPLLAPSLDCLQAHLQKFQELLESNRLVACKKHWLRLQARCQPHLPCAANFDCKAQADSTSARDRQRDMKACEHGSKKRNRRICACPHGKEKQSCEQCHACPHGRLKHKCPLCTACPHCKLKHNCTQCVACPHGMIKHSCKQCKACPHGKVKRNCAQCNPCQHGNLKRNCEQCHACAHGKAKHLCVHCSRSACPHGRLKQSCVQCSACPHGKLRGNCKQCNSCQHGKVKHHCPQCSACPHGKLKYDCIKCSACPHGILRRKAKKNCRDCAQARKG